MLPVAECKRILNGSSIKYSDEDIKKIMELLYQLAEIEKLRLMEEKENEK